MPAGQLSRSSKKDQDKSTQSGGGGSGGAVSVYTSDFPDSTKGTALLSPPDSAREPLFAFDPTVSFEFPDWSQHEFLLLTLHVGGNSSGSGKKQDVYQRIEERLRSYRTEAEKRSKNGMEQGKNASGHPSENPFSKEAAGTAGLAKKPKASISF